MFGLAIMIACVVLAYRYAEMENLRGWLWALASFVLYLASGLLLNLLGVLLVQVALLVTIRCLAIRQHGY